MYWGVGVAGTLNGPLLNDASTMAVRLPPGRRSFAVFASDGLGAQFAEGRTVTLTATFDDGTTVQGSTRIGTAATSTRLVRLQYVKLEGEQYVRVQGDLQHGSVFYVEATFDSEPAEENHTVTLSWQAGAATDIPLKRTSDGKVFRSGPIRLQPPR
jgi:hypothetical protein